MQEVNDGNFEDVVIAGSQEGVVVVDYYSDSCAPCKRLMPKLESVSGRNTKPSKIVKVNVDGNFESSMRNMVRTIPTLVVYKNGEVIESHRGCSQMSEDAIEALLSI